MKAIIELQKQAMDSSTDIVELVRSAYAIAYKLDLQDFADWCNAERDGYTNNTELPEYRWLQGKLMCDHNNQEKPFEIEGLSADTIMKVSGIWYKESLLELKIAFDKSSQKRLRMKLHPDIERLINKLYKGDMMKRQNDMISSIGISPNIVDNKMLQNCIPEIELFISIPIVNFTRISNGIRNKIHTWALDCEKQGILGEEWQFSPEEKAMAQNVTYNIDSVQNMANHNTESTINQTAQNMTVTKGDLQSLVTFLSDKGISEPDIQELKEIIETEPNITVDGVKNGKIKQWLGNIAVEANLVARGVEIGLLVEGIKYYFGF